MKVIKILGFKFWVYHAIFFKYFKVRITDILIFIQILTSRLIFANNFKTRPFCKPCVFIKDADSVAGNFKFHFVFVYFEGQKLVRFQSVK